MLANRNDLNFGTFTRYAVGNGGFSGWTLNCTSCYDSTSTKVLTVTFFSELAISPFLGRSFDGRIAEVWVLDGSQGLSNAQVQKIGTYLSTKY